MSENTGLQRAEDVVKSRDSTLLDRRGESTGNECREKKSGELHV